jgi:membrane-associated phospholipid phosphatase
MKLSAVLWIALTVIAIPPCTLAQMPPPDQNPSSNVPASASPSTTALPPVQQPSVAFDRPVSWKRVLPNLLSDQERIWTFPARLVNRQDWIPATAIVGTTAALWTLDPTEASYFRRTSTFNGFNHIFSGNATTIGAITAPVSLYVVGLIRKDSKMQHTALLAGEAVVDAEVVTTVLKDATKRVRPAAIRQTGNFNDSWFENSGSFLRGSGSFPSGHTIAAFSVATIVARRYRNHRWVPYAAYGMAGLVGFSRLSLSAHFVSDVFMGGALGYSISRFTVLRQ